LVEERNDPHLELDRVLRAQVEDPTRPVRLEDRGLQGEVENGASHAAVSSLVSPHHLPLADLRLEVLAPLLALRAAHLEDVRVVSGEPQLDPELDLPAHVVGQDEPIGHEAVEELLAAEVQEVLRLREGPAELAVGRRRVDLGREHARGLDRKSTRLNSSHVKISYA